MKYASGLGQETGPSDLQLATCNLQLETCNLQPATFHPMEI
jgi:hypothetical protein